nr:hypothetical protein [Tanacetum cinerariifolium]
MPITPSGSPLPQPPPPPPPAGASGAPGSKALSSSKSTASSPQSMAWTTSDTRYESAGLYGTQELSPTDSLFSDDSILDDQWKPLFAEERPATPEPTWTIPSSNVSDVENNWATALASTYVTPAENSLLAKTGDMTNFLNCSRWKNVTSCSQIRLTGRIQNEISKGSNHALSISKMKAASYPDFGLKMLVPEQMWIEDMYTYDISAQYDISHWWFNRHKFYIDRYKCPSRQKEVRSHMRILSVVRIKAYSRYGYDYFSEIVLRRADLQEHTIAEKDFKNLHPSDFEDLNLLLLQGYEFKHDYTIIESPRAIVFSVNNNKRKIMRFNKIYKFSDGTLTRILEALAYRVKEFKIKRLNLGMNTRFWTQKDVIRSKEFIAAIESRLKTDWIYPNLECFVGGRLRDIDYRLLQRTK